MVIDTNLVSRFQFAFTISFHILFPAFSIGLAIFIAAMEAIWLKTRKPIYLKICKFWTKVFALTFGMGVVSGIVMAFQLGTNWAGFSNKVGDVLGVLFTYEVMTAFFIEAGFLGVMLFGWERVGPKLHFLATLLVVIGTTLSAYWILSANSWMQHPIGFIDSGSIFLPESWKEIIFNPATFPRFLHMILAAYISAAFVISSVSALYLLKARHQEFARICFSFVWLSLIVLVPLQIFFVDRFGVMVHDMQPIKTASMEGVWNTQAGAPYLIFAIPDQKQQKNYLEIPIPHFGSLLNTHSWNGVLTGLKTVSPADQPPVAIVFYSFRVMVYLGFFMLLLVLSSLWLRYKKQLYHTTWFLYACLFSAPIGFIALWCGWITAEEGRQPWVVYNLLRTANAVSNVTLHNVIISFALIFVVYGIIFGFFYFYFLHHFLHQGPEEATQKPTEKQPFQYMAAPISKNEFNK